MPSMPRSREKDLPCQAASSMGPPNRPHLRRGDAFVRDSFVRTGALRMRPQQPPDGSGSLLARTAHPTAAERLRLYPAHRYRGPASRGRTNARPPGRPRADRRRRSSHRRAQRESLRAHQSHLRKPRTRRPRRAHRCGSRRGRDRSRTGIDRRRCLAGAGRRLPSRNGHASARSSEVCASAVEWRPPVSQHNVQTEPESMPAPGVGIRHYAPRARLVLDRGRARPSSQPPFRASLKIALNRGFALA